MFGFTPHGRNYTPKRGCRTLSWCYNNLKSPGRTFHKILVTGWRYFPFSTSEVEQQGLEGVEFRALCRPVEFFHTKLGTVSLLTWLCSCGNYCVQTKSPTQTVAKKWDKVSIYSQTNNCFSSVITSFMYQYTFLRFFFYEIKSLLLSNDSSVAIMHSVLSQCLSCVAFAMCICSFTAWHYDVSIELIHLNIHPSIPSQSQLTLGENT